MKSAAVLVTALLALAACGDEEPAAARLPDLTLASLAAGGAPIELAELAGPAVINLWATWCGPCREELPDFQQVATARPDVRFIGVDVQETGDARRFLDDLGIRFDQYVDERGVLAEELGAAAMPVTLVVDADGTITTQHLGPMTADELEGALEAVG